jgi:FkbM family methyltransferase
MSSNIFRRLKHGINVLRRRDVHLSLDVTLPTEYHGTEYGGFAILADSLTNDSNVLSCGIGEDASFDLSLLKKYGCQVTGVDPTPKAVEYVRKNLPADRFSFVAVAVADTDGQAGFYLPKKTDSVSGSLTRGSHTSSSHITVPCLRVGSILSQVGITRLDLLKLDIEGSEYTVVADYLNDARAPKARQIALEFHHHFSNYTPEQTLSLCRTIQGAGYELAWTSHTHREALFVQGR